MTAFSTSGAEGAVSVATIPERASESFQVSHDPIRLFTFMAYLAIGGTERQIFNIRDGLDRDRFQQHLGCFGRFDDQLSADLSSTPVQVYRIGKLYGVRAMREVLRLARYLRNERIDVMHAYNFYANVFAVPAARLAGVPIVLASCRDTGEYWTARQRRVNQLVCRLADGVIVNAEAIKGRLIDEGYAPHKITVIHNGIHCPALQTAAEKKAVRQTLNVPVDGPLIAVVARLARLKGIEYFIHAAKSVLTRLPDAHFLIVGDTCVDPGYREELKQLTAGLGLQDRLTYTGFRLDIPNILPALTVSVLPSISGEGLSNSLLKSMAAAVPVVATNIGGNPEVVKDGVTGMLVPPKNPEELARAICQVIETRGLAAAMGRAGRQRVIDHFSNESMIETTQSLYQNLLGRRKAGLRGHFQRRH